MVESLSYRDFKLGLSAAACRRLWFDVVIRIRLKLSRGLLSEEVFGLSSSGTREYLLF